MTNKQIWSCPICFSEKENESFNYNVKNYNEQLLRKAITIILSYTNDRFSKSWVPTLYEIANKIEELIEK